MSDVWNSLVGIQKFMQDMLDGSAKRVEEPDMERFNQDGWINLVWENEHIRRAHIDVVDARETKGLYMMHICVFPTLTNNAPIFGFDVIAGKNKMTGAFLDFSPTLDKEHRMIEEFGKVSTNLNFKRERELPDWGKAIFSDHMIAAGNVKEKDEIEKVSLSSKLLFNHYMMAVPFYTNKDNDAEAIKDSHNRYAHYQKQNPHTPRVMKSLGLNEDDVDVFVRDLLFPEI